MNVIETATDLASGPIGWAKTFFKSKKVIIIACAIAAAAAIGGFLIWQNGNLFDKAVDAKVETGNLQASNQSYVAKGEADAASAVIDDRFEQRQTITQKEYVHVRTIIHDAPIEDRTRQADPLILDTLNGLERMSRGGEDAGGVHHADDPAG